MPIDLELRLEDEVVKTDTIDFGEEKTYTIEEETFSEDENVLSLYLDGISEISTEIVKEVAKYSVDIDKEQSTTVVGQGNEVSVFATVTNVGNDAGAIDVVMDFGDEEEVDSEEVVLAPNNSRGVELTYELDEEKETGTEIATIRSTYESDEVEVEIEKSGFVPTIYEPATAYRVEQGDELEVAVDIVNQHHEQDVQVIELVFDGVIVDTAAAYLDTGEETRLELFHGIDEEKELGTYEATVRCERHEASFDVTVKDVIEEVSVAFHSDFEDIKITIEGVTEVTNEDGVAIFEELVKDSEYEYEVHHESIIDETGTFTAESNKQIQLDLTAAFADVLFKFGDGEDDIEVTIDGDTKVTDENGEVLFDNLTNQQEYEYLAESIGYEDIEGTFTAQPDKEIDLSDELVEIWVDVIFDVGIEGAKVIVGDKELATDSEGYVTFEDLENGTTYTYTVSHDDIYTVTDEFQAADNKIVSITTKERVRVIITGIDQLDREPILEKHEADNNVIELKENPNTNENIRVYKVQE